MPNLNEHIEKIKKLSGVMPIKEPSINEEVRTVTPLEIVSSINDSNNPEAKKEADRVIRDLINGTSDLEDLLYVAIRHKILPDTTHILEQ